MCEVSGGQHALPLAPPLGRLCHSGMTTHPCRCYTRGGCHECQGNHPCPVGVHCHVAIKTEPVMSRGRTDMGRSTRGGGSGTVKGGGAGTVTAGVEPPPLPIVQQSSLNKKVH